MSVTIRHRNLDAYKTVLENLRKVAKKEIAVGFPAGKCQAYSGSEHHGFEQEGPIEVAQVAAAHVYGVGVPRRDFMSKARPDIIKKALPMLDRLPRAAQKDGLVEKVMESAGLEAQKAIRKAITDLKQPPNSPRTIELKGRNNPLIWTGHMRQSTTYVIRDKRKKT